MLYQSCSLQVRFILRAQRVVLLLSPEPSAALTFTEFRKVLNGWTKPDDVHCVPICALILITVHSLRIMKTRTYILPGSVRTHQDSLSQFVGISCFVLSRCIEPQRNFYDHHPVCQQIVASVVAIQTSPPKVVRPWIPNALRCTRL